MRSLYGIIMQIILQQIIINHCLSFLLSHPSSVDMISYDKRSVFTGCNSDCLCSASDWDPICGENGITYVSPCLAGCTSSAGSGKNTVSHRSTQWNYSGKKKRLWEWVFVQYTACIAVCVCILLYMVVCVRPCVCMSLQVFSNCSCVGVAGNFTASTGQCPHTDDCDRMFPYFLALSVITSFIISLGGTPGYMILIRSDFIYEVNIMKGEKKETLKSLNYHCSHRCKGSYQL